MPTQEQNTHNPFPSLCAQVIELKNGEQNWFTSRLWQVLAFTLSEITRIQSEAQADAAYFEKLCVMNIEAILLMDRHLANVRYVSSIFGASAFPENARTTKLLKTILTTLDAGYDLLVDQFGNPGLLNSSDKLALSKAIFYNMKDVDFEDAHRDAEKLREILAEAEAAEEPVHG
jgi:anthranilate/para-aminobenzoate synthase component I